MSIPGIRYTKQTKNVRLHAIKPFTALLTAAAVLLLPTMGTADDGKDRQKQLNQTQFEEVTVKNVQFPVRVSQKGKPVGGLKKKDFNLFVNGKKTPINAFFEVRKKLHRTPQSTTALQTHQPPQATSRLFVIVFNVSDYHVDVAKDVNLLFSQVLQPGDRYMVLSNQFFLPERKLENPEKEKKKILDILRREANRLKMLFLQTEVDLRGVVTHFLDRMADPEEQKEKGYPYEIFREFFREYLMYFEQARQGYFGLAREQYVKIADYLKSQDVEKWVLSFYQIGIFPKFKSMGTIQGYISAYSSGVGSTPIKKLLMDFMPRLDDVDKWMVDNISKLFVNSGATMHTLLIKPVNKSNMDYFDYQTIPTDSESILRTIARLTGGAVVQSRDSGEFIKKITEKEDIYYMISYVPPEQKNQKTDKTRIRVSLKNKKHRNEFRLSYDNLKKPRLFRNILKKIKQDNPQIKINSIGLDKSILSVVVSNIKTIPLTNRNKERAGKIEAQVLVMNNKSEVVWKSAKQYKCKQNQSMFRTPLPALKNGNYDVLVEVRDLLSWKTDATGKNISIETPGG